MLRLARLPSISRQYSQLDLVNTIFPVGQNDVFEGICFIQIKDDFHTRGLQWLARPVSDKQFLSLAVPQFEGQISVISVLPCSSQVLALLRDSKKQQTLSIDSPGLNGWKPLPAMNLPRDLNSCSGAVIGDFFYIAGGLPAKGSGMTRGEISEAERFDLRTNQWEKIPAMTRPHSFCKGFVMDGCFFVINLGNIQHPQRRAAERFDPATNVWTFILDFLPRDFEDYRVTVLKNELYMLKWSKAEPCGRIFRYNKSTGDWIFIDRVPDLNGKYCSKKQIYSVGNELWIVDCQQSEILSEFNGFFSENYVWPVCEGPSFWPTNLENINDGEPQRFVHACKIGVVGENPLWRTIPIFRL